ncbi:MAG: hypothetical protein A3D99_00850 [Candidatus Andersenbacteria bacterium RIFCSPHIGHO2_12_FULL_45_11]|uniref:Uncharacterized protein n=1 Tax=Candidatus Andersenbacteria bacterium RIFCSPHIGHO2_12_FULL_45_11 TaxID=1797281 RepID=A0A1G1X5A1_9BACT|nr:MAG: hypothetical protein A3D99_00850 [Candidatus Andersenbacteria bacterium RIFCSPHIGHO2_12_FULL_45_11]
MQFDDIEENQLPKHKLPRPEALNHYYGDTVRKLFVVSGIIMLASLPFFNTYLPVPAYISLFAVVVIALVSGFTNPMQRWATMLDILVSLIACVTFEYSSVVGYGIIPPALFWINQLLALLFFIALYYSTKSYRGILVGDYNTKQRRRIEKERRNSIQYRK